MTFKALKNKNIVWLAFCFAVFFFGFNGASQFFTVYYKQAGIPNVALTALAIVYITIIPASFIAPWVIGKLGLKRSIILPCIAYVLFIPGAISKNLSVIYALAVLVGFAAAPLAVARSTYLLKCAEDG